MAGIMSQLHPSDMGILLLQLTDKLPRLVFGTVVDIDDEAIRLDLRLADEFLEQTGQTVIGLCQYRFFIVARYDDGQRGGVITDCIASFLFDDLV